MNIFIYVMQDMERELRAFAQSRGLSYSFTAVLLDIDLNVMQNKLTILMQNKICLVQDMERERCGST